MNDLDTEILSDEKMMQAYQQGRVDKLAEITRQLKPFIECKENCCNERDDCWECMYQKLEDIEKQLGV